MLPQLLISELNSLLGKITEIKPLSGGSINNAFKISTSQNHFFLKTNSNTSALNMFQTEAKGLHILKETLTIKTPKVIHVGKIGNDAILILEFLHTNSVSNIFWERLGQQLAFLHQTTATQFGLDHSNFIGRLPQSNQLKDTWVEFFIEERMLPQINLSKKNQLLPSSLVIQFDKLFKNLGDIFPKESPSLIHGDFWSGNFIKGKNQTPVLIDPAVYFGHREMDLAMSYLFGEFDKRFYHSYHEAFPMQPNFEKRVKVYQLYYLMVHVNLFGRGYLSSIQQILKEY